MTFALTKEALFGRFRDFRVYKAKFAEQYVARQIKKALTENPLPDVQVNFIKRRDKISIDIKGSKPTAIQSAYAEIAQMEKKLSQEFLRDNYYQEFTTHDQVSAIKPNHTLIAQSSVNDLKVLRDPILGTVSIKNIRKVTNYTLGFIQSIPYSTLESRVTASGAGFNPPLKLLWENQGDCDSKVTLTGAILRTLMPRIKMVFVFIEQHALIGIDIPPRDGETTVTVEGTTYVLAEPTGPAMYALGKIAPGSELAINNGHYTAEKFF